METPNENPEKHPPSLEIKEGEPKIHTVYAYIKAGEKAGNGRRVDDVMAIYTNTEDPMTFAHLDDMFAKEDDVLVPLHVYEREEDLPEAIKKQLRTYDGKHERLPQPVLQKEEGVVYAVLPNTESAEGSGYSFIWALVTDPLLANRIALGNGPSGSDADVKSFPLNQLPMVKHPYDQGQVKIRRDKKDNLSDELYV